MTNKTELYNGMGCFLVLLGLALLIWVIKS